MHWSNIRVKKYKFNIKINYIYKENFDLSPKSLFFDLFEPLINIINNYIYYFRENS